MIDQKKRERRAYYRAPYARKIEQVTVLDDDGVLYARVRYSDGTVGMADRSRLRATLPRLLEEKVAAERGAP